MGVDEVESSSTNEGEKTAEWTKIQKPACVQVVPDDPASREIHCRRAIPPSREGAKGNVLSSVGKGSEEGHRHLLCPTRGQAAQQDEGSHRSSTDRESSRRVRHSSHAAPSSGPRLRACARR